MRLDSFKLTEKAKRSLTFMWDSIASFTCKSDLNVTHCLRTVTNYEVREIYITLHPRDASYSGTLDREFSICFTGDDTITSARMTMEDNASYQTIVSQSTDVTDTRRKMEILKFVEDFRSYYDAKDLKALEQIYSDDALIITGKVIRRKQGDHTAVLKEDRQVVYKEQSKKEYLDRLRTVVFPSASYIRVNFSDIKVARHPSIDGYYGVTLRQGYESSVYSDEGYLFMLWDFRDEDHPQIHVRTWQPYWMDDNKTSRFDESKVFGINDFKVR